MKKLDSIQETLLEMGFVINGENFVKHDITIPFKEINGTVDSFLEEAKRRGWIQEEQQGVGKLKSMLLEPGVILGYPQRKGNIAYNNNIFESISIPNGCVEGRNGQCGCIERSKRLYGL